MKGKAKGFLPQILFFFRSFKVDKESLKVASLCILTAFTFWLFNSLNDFYTTRIDYPIEFVYDNSDRFIRVKEPVQKIELDVSGGGWALFRSTFAFHKKPITLKLEHPAKTKSLTSYQLMSLISNQVHGFTINYVVNDTIALDIQPKAEKTVAFRVDSLHIPLKENYRITSPISLSQDSIVITGAQKIINALPDYFVYHLDDKNIDNDFLEVVDILPPDHMSISPTEIGIKFGVSEFRQQTFNIPITLLNFPEDSSIFLSRQTVQLNCLALREAIQQIDTLPILVFADLKSHDQDDSTLILRLTNSSKTMFIDCSIDSPVVRLNYAQ